MTHRSLPLASLCLCVGLVVALTACAPSSEPPYSDAEIEFLASDAHVVVGRVPLTIPYVALSEFVGRKVSFSLNKKRDRQEAKERLEAFRKLASNQQTAPSVNKLEITVYTYGWDDFRGGKVRICPLLGRQWAKSVCNDPWAPLQQALPRSFYLVDGRNFNVFDSHWTVGMERMSDQLNEMHLEVGKVAFICDKKASSTTTFCTAAVSVRPHLTAVWTVWSSAVETSEQQADRQGKAITAFVLNALSPTEDYPTLFTVACGLKDPKASTGPHGNRCQKAPMSRP